MLVELKDIEFILKNMNNEYKFKDTIGDFKDYCSSLFIKGWIVEPKGSSPSLQGIAFSYEDPHLKHFW